MEENKYYIPSIEEFHVGFECEMLDHDFQGQSDGGEWKKRAFDRSTLMDTLQHWKHFQDYRVKYLDRQDIEECGWEYSSKTIDIWFKKEGMFHAISGGHKFTELKLHYGITDHCLFIDAYFGGDHEGRLFEGVIKNKSELKRVMKMLCIDQKD